MNIVANTEPRIQDVKVTSDTITAYLVDGRVLSVPLAWSWRLSEATAKQRARFELIGDGQGVHWPDVDDVWQAVEEVPKSTPLNRETLAVFESRPYFSPNHLMNTLSSSSRMTPSSRIPSAFTSRTLGLSRAVKAMSVSFAELVVRVAGVTSVVFLEWLLWQRGSLCQWVK